MLKSVLPDSGLQVSVLDLPEFPEACRQGCCRLHFPELTPACGLYFSLLFIFSKCNQNQRFNSVVYPRMVRKGIAEDRIRTHPNGQTRQKFVIVDDANLNHVSTILIGCVT